MSMLAEEVANYGVTKVENLDRDDPGKSMVPSSTLIEVLTWAFGDYRGRISGDDKAMTYSAVWACVRIISNALSMIGWHVFETEGKGKRKIDQSERTAAGDVAWMLNTQPKVSGRAEQTSVDLRQALAADALQHGNGYAFIDKDPMGRILQLWRLDQSRVTPKRLGGQYVYVVKNGDGIEPDILTPGQLLHFKGIGDGLVGFSVIEMARRTIQLGLSQEQYGATYFERGPMPGGLLELPGNIKEQDKEQMREGFQRLYGGAHNAGRVVVTTGTSKFTPLTLNNSDAQFLESRRFSVEEISRWFGVPPHMLASLDRATFSNIEHQRIEFVQDCLLPWARRMEAEVDMKLFGDVNRGKFWTKLNLAALLRGDTATQTASLQQKVTSGMMMLNEAREELDLNPIPDGDTTLIQGAMVPLERALNPPEPKPAPVPQQAPNPPDPPEDEPPANMMAPLHRLFASTCERLLRVEADKARRANNRGKLQDWKREFYSRNDAAAAQYEADVSASLEALESKADARTIAVKIGTAHNRYGGMAHDLFKALSDSEWPQQFAKECVKTVWRNRG